MPLKSGRFTPQERVFIQHMATSNDPTYSATKAGYRHPQMHGHAVAGRDQIKAQVAQIQTDKLFSEGLPLAVTTLCEIMADPRQSSGARVQASKIVLDRTLGDAAQGQDKQPHEYTPEELAQALSKARLHAAALEHVAADRAKPVIDHDARPGIFD